MTAYETQLREMLGALQAPSGLLERRAQFVAYKALSTPENVAKLLVLLDDTRTALEAAANGLRWYREAYPEADSGADDEMMATIEAVLQAEPHPEVADIPVLAPDAPAVVDIPAGVYYDSTADNFYQGVTHKGMGTDFFLRWREHRDRFPRSVRGER